MDVPTIEMTAEQAREKVREFTARRRRTLTELDHSLYRGYKALSEGLRVIDADEAIRRSGVFPENYCPKIAMARADLEEVFLNHQHHHVEGQEPDHQVGFKPWSYRLSARGDVYADHSAKADALGIGRLDYFRQEGLEINVSGIESPAGDVHRASRAWFRSTYRAMVPTIPYHLRPADDEIGKYFIMWEVEKWETHVDPPAPADPFLLERIAHPIYVVVAEWNLTPLEQKLLESFRR